jgi:hypothetical protein
MQSGVICTLEDGAHFEFAGVDRRALSQAGRIKGWSSWAAARGSNLLGELKHLQNTSEMLCHLTQVSTRDSLRDWRNIIVKENQFLPAPAR